ncbi:hypothetical protein ACMHYB_43865 [Sorangium sp. So ce1128]
MSLGERLDRSLYDVFGSRPTYFVDSFEILDFLTSIGCRCHCLAAHDDPSALPHDLSANAVLIFTERDNASQFYYAGFGGSRVLMVPLRPFDASLRAATYALERIAEIDFVRVTNRNRQVIELMESCDGFLRIEGNGCDLIVELADEITLMQTMADPLLRPREWGAIGQWIEVGLIPNGGHIRRLGYNVSGQFVAQGTSIARHQAMPEAKAHLHVEARRLVHELREDGQFPLTLSVEGSQIREIRTQGGMDLYSEVRRLSGEHTDMMLLEVAISGDVSSSDRAIDWSVNSVMNEGFAGAHIAVGDGINAAHIDFIALDARVAA